jgi:rare lipoprotein A
MNIVESRLTAKYSEKQAPRTVQPPRQQDPRQQDPRQQDPMDQFLDRLEARSMALVLSDQRRLAQKARSRSSQVLMAIALGALWISTLVLAVAYIRVNNHSQQVVQRVPFHVQAAAEAPKPPAMDYVVVPTPGANPPASSRRRSTLSDSNGTASYFTSPPQNSEQFTATHSSLAFGTRVRVTNVANGRSVVVRITGHGSSHKNRIINVSEPAAEELGFLKSGTAHVRLELIPN